MGRVETAVAEGWRSYLTTVRCSGCGRQEPSEQILHLCTTCGRVLLADYDLASLRESLRPSDLLGRRWDMWRYAELLPVRDATNVVSLGEGMTPLMNTPPRARISWGLERGELLIKDEGQNPTGSFKARGISAAISKALELGVRTVGLPSAGNAGSAAAAYGAAAGMTVHVAMPRDVPRANRDEAWVYGADVLLVDGLIGDAGRLVADRGVAEGWYDLSTLKEPYRQEGKKTMGFELAEQGGWGDDCLPDVIVYPAGGGTGIVGMWKAFEELDALGWIGPKRPKMVIVQAAGCAPLVRAFEEGTEHARPWENASTIAAGIRVPSAVGDYLILAAVRASGGTAVAVSDAEIMDAQLAAGRQMGVYMSPEGAATLVAVGRLRKNGFLEGHERVAIFNTGSGLKYDPPRREGGRPEIQNGAVR